MQGLHQVAQKSINTHWPLKSCRATLSPDKVSTTISGAGRGFPAHGVVNGNGKFHLENVANVHLLPEAGAYLIVAPIKIAGGSGGQVRIFAVVP